MGAVLTLQANDPRRVGSYRLLGRLGAGGMGQVYLGVGEHADLVAVKVVHPELAHDEEFRRRFRREVASSRRVTGPGMAAVIDADPDAPAPWLATEYVAGPSLEQAVRDAGALPAATVHVLGFGLARALVTIHGAGLVHRDVKPANVLLGSEGPRLVDLGISRAVDGTRITLTGMVVGTPAFMSPEQVDGAEIGPASDVFSVGAVLGYAATGHGPFGEALPNVLLHRIANAPPDLDGLAEPLRTPIAACLAKRPAERPTAAELLDLLGQPSRATGPGWLPATVAAMAPLIPDLGPADADDLTEVGAGTRPAMPAYLPSGDRADAMPPAPPRRIGRRTLLAGAVAGVAAASSVTALVLTGPDTPDTPPAGGQPPAPPAPAPRWTFEGPAGISALVAAGDALYVGTGSGLQVLDAGTGAVRWRFGAPPGGGGPFGDEVAVAVSSGAVFVATNGVLAALDAARGQERWRVGAEAFSGSLAGVDLAATGDGLYVTVGDQLAVLDAASGAVRWTHTMADRFASSPRVDGGRCFVANGANVDALDVASGRLLWRYTAGADNATSLAVAGGVVVMASWQSAAAAIDAANGALRWEAAVGTAGVGGDGQPVIVGDVVVVLGMDEQVHALEIGTGVERWAHPDRTAGGGTVDRAPVAAEGTVYTGSSSDGRLYAVDAVTGSRRWEYRSSAGSVSDGVGALAAAGGTVYVAGYLGGRVQAVE